MTRAKWEDLKTLPGAIAYEMRVRWRHAYPWRIVLVTPFSMLRAWAHDWEWVGATHGLVWSKEHGWE